MKRTNIEYYLGLDMGTGSVGWAVTDRWYQILKRHGKALWGIRLFETANPAEERRLFRTSRRRTERKKNRIALLQEIFAEEICKVDAGFYQRMQESKYWPEDKRDLDGNVPELPYTLFVEKEFTDKEYHQMYPTVFHLRYALMQDPGTKPDIRLVYLAIHHIIKNRGHFLFEGKSLSEVGDFSTAIYALAECAQEQGIELLLTEEMVQQLEAIMDQAQYTKSVKKTMVAKVIAGSDKQKKALSSLITGCTTKLSDLFGDPSLETQEVTKVCFSESSYEEQESNLESILADRFLLIAAAKAVYDWAVLHDILGDAKCLSEAKVRIYDKHREDLKILKNLFRSDKKIFQEVFGVPEKGNAANYSAYIGMVKKNGKKVPIEKRCSQEDFYKFLKKKLDALTSTEHETEMIDKIKAEMEQGCFLPKQRIRDNGVIPYQLHEKELNAILEHAKKYYPFLEEKDEAGYTPIEKIQKIFCFRIPYYVGPLNTAHQESGGNSWMVRKEEGKIYPWNFAEMVDEEQSAAAFIERMTNKCTYLVGEDVLPKESLLYAKFNVLNELNNLKIDGESVSVELKQMIYDGVFKKYQRVTGKKVKDFLIREGVISRQQELSGFDQNFKSSLKAYHDFKQIVGEGILTEKEQEDIIKDITLFGDAASLLKRRMRRKYPQLSEKQVSQLAAKKYSGWGRLSRTFLEEIESVNKETGEIINIITALWETNDNLMQLLSQKYDYWEQVQQRNMERAAQGNVEYRDVEELYVSPAVKRPIWQTIRIVREVEQIMGCAPKRIFIEMAREPGQKGVRKISRRSRMLELYKACKKEEPELYERLSTRETDNSMRSDKLFLYYSQMGRCMYSGEAIDLDELFTNRYDIDHIYPQSKVMDDSLDNRVLVKRELNTTKEDRYPVPEQYVKNAKHLWETLYQKGLISKEKYRRLTRRDPFTEGELAGFIARQLVETRQSTKAVAQLLKKSYPDSEIVYAKAAAVSEFRHEFDLIKVREVNDYHHAKDAYLNIVVGNTYFVKFTKDAAWFVRNNPGRTYNLRHMFDRETVKRGDEVAWIPGNAGSIRTVKHWMAKNNILFTRRSYEGKGGLFKQNILKKGNGQVPIKGASDERIQCIEKYGGYDKASSAYFMLVESEDKKGALHRTMECVPVYLASSLKTVAQKEEYCRDVLGMLHPRICLPEIKIDTLFEVDGFRMHLSGRTGNQLIFKGANELVLSAKLQQVVKQAGKYCADHKENKNAVLSEKSTLTEEGLEELYAEFLHKLEDTVYGRRLSTQIDTLRKGKKTFLELSREEKCLVVTEILHLFQCSSQLANLSIIQGPGQAGRLGLNKDITKIDKVCIVHQSTTGFYEQVIDLKTI